MRRWHLTFLIAALYALTPVTSSMAQERLSVTEDWLRKQLGSGPGADVGLFCATQNDSECKKIDALLLKKILLEKNITTDQQIVLIGAEIVGNLDLSGALIERRVSFIKCHFADQVSMVGTVFARDLFLDGAVFSRGVNADNIHIGGQLFFRNNSVVEGGDFDMTNAYIKSDIAIADSKFRGQLKLERATIGTKVLIQTSSFEKGILASFMDIAGSLNMGPQVHIDNLPMSFRAASIGGRLDLVDSTIASPLNLEDMNIKGNILFSDVDIVSGSDFSGSKISGDLRFRNSRIRHDLIAQRLKMAEALFSQTTCMRTQISI